ncbi:MAG TPA: hypothetical protein DCS55_00155 [Acidimicrobiaceae bacterium]|nr:hypothetical protein [Acidimicrobiaceae bacterium]
MGAQYTTKALAEEVVQYALEPLVYDPGPQNEPDQGKWNLKTPAAILDLRVCDPAVGSGAILTAAGRYLADRLVESVLQYGAGEGPFATRLHDLATAPAEEQTVLARREVVDHCLYGVDKNPVAAEMAKLSLWLTTMARERPFTFLDHAIQVGDSLLGVTDIDQLRWLHLDPTQRRGQRGFESLGIDLRLNEATELAVQLREMSVVTVRDATEKQRLNDTLRAQLADLAVVGDAVVGAALSTSGSSKTSFEDRLGSQIERVRTLIDDEVSDVEREAAVSTLLGLSTGWLRTDLPDETPAAEERRCLHWPLAFPEVFLGPGCGKFDAVVANPPFIGGKRISGALGTAFREHLVAAIAKGVTGNADLAAYFVLRMCSVARSVGTLATNTITQGDTREVGLDRLAEAGWTIQRAVKSEPWPNEANLEISKVWLWEQEWCGPRHVGSRPVSRITPQLDPGRRVSGQPERLAANSGRSFIGCLVGSKGFVLTQDEARELVASEAANAQVVRPYLDGQDFNSSPSQSARRWVVDFDEMSESEARRYVEPWSVVEKRVRDEVLGKKGYPGWSDRWWQYWNVRPAMRRAISDKQMVVAIGRVSKAVVPSLVLADQVLHEKLVVFDYDDFGHLGVLTSALHWWWVVTYTSTLETRINYAPSDAFETFPQPLEDLDEIGSKTEQLSAARSEIMERDGIGLTKFYNRLHGAEEDVSEIEHIRELHADLDVAVRDAYGWSDIELDHYHWETPQGMRFTISPEAKDEILDRLLELNHERYAEEVAAGLHAKKSKTATKRASKKDGKDQGSLL